jgi:hypothetical protein
MTSLRASNERNVINMYAKLVVAEKSALIDDPFRILASTRVWLWPPKGLITAFEYDTNENAPRKVIRIVTLALTMLCNV